MATLTRRAGHVDRGGLGWVVSMTGVMLTAALVARTSRPSHIVADGLLDFVVHSSAGEGWSERKIRFAMLGGDTARRRLDANLWGAFAVGMVMVAGVAVTPAMRANPQVQHPLNPFTFAVVVSF